MQSSNTNQPMGGMGSGNDDPNQANNPNFNGANPNNIPPNNLFMKNQTSNFDDPAQSNEDEFAEGTSIGKPRAMTIEAGKSPDKNC